MKDYNLLLEHILESISWIERHCRSYTKKSFLKSVKTQDSVIRRLAIIGEASRGIPFALENVMRKSGGRKLSE